MNTYQFMIISLPISVVFYYKLNTISNQLNELDKKIKEIQIDIDEIIDNAIIDN